jgi:hypothetical protein
METPPSAKRRLSSTFLVLLLVPNINYPIIYLLNLIRPRCMY